MTQRRRASSPLTTNFREQPHPNRMVRASAIRSTVIRSWASEVPFVQTLGPWHPLTRTADARRPEPISHENNVTQSAIPAEHVHCGAYVAKRTHPCVGSRTQGSRAEIVTLRSR